MENFPPGYMTNVTTLISTLSIFHSWQVIYHLALLIVFTSHSSLDMQDAVHKMLVERLVSQGYCYEHLRNSFNKFYVRYQDLIVKDQRSVRDSFPSDT